MRYFFIGFFLLCALVVSVAGFRGRISRKPPLEVFPDMDRQLKVRPQEESEFFADGMSSRPPVPGTIARGAAFQNTPANTGMVSGTTNYVPSIPIPVTAEFMQRGRQRYDIFCLPCHGAAGDGKGITTKFGMPVVANLQDKRIVTMPDGEVFNVISHGRNLMGAYSAQINIEDRWAVVAYLRALQLSHLMDPSELPESVRASLPK